VASNFRVEKRPRAPLATFVRLVSCSAFSSNLNMEVTCSSETSVDFQWTTRRYIAEGRTLHKHRYSSRFIPGGQSPVFIAYEAG
jgi:hypothetical protein